MNAYTGRLNRRSSLQHPTMPYGMLRYRLLDGHENWQYIGRICRLCEIVGMKTLVSPEMSGDKRWGSLRVCAGSRWVYMHEIPRYAFCGVVDIGSSGIFREIVFELNLRDNSGSGGVYYESNNGWERRMTPGTNLARTYVASSRRLQFQSSKWVSNALGEHD